MSNEHDEPPTWQAAEPTPAPGATPAEGTAGDAAGDTAGDAADQHGYEPTAPVPHDTDGLTHAESAPIESAQAESAQAESAQAESAQAESAQAESAQAESAQAESAHAEFGQAEPTQVLDASLPQHAEPTAPPLPPSYPPPHPPPYPGEAPPPQRYGSPYGQPYSPPHPQPAAYAASTPGAAQADERRFRPPGWMWPLVAATALIVGALGGALGGAIVADNTGDNVISVTGGSGDSDTDQAAPAPLPADNASIPAVAQQLLPSTVQVNADGGSDRGGATGSGFVYDDAGHVITNNHVVRGATNPGELTVVDVKGITHRASIVGRSTVYDLAVLEVAKPGDLKPAAIGSSDALRIGDGLVAIGSPLGLSSTVTSGIVSALNRPVTTGEDQEFSFINAVQTDAAINPGNSGGPLVNMRGQVVGVNSAIATAGGSSGEAGSIGVGFAIPMKQVRITAGQILKTGEASYPVIGANVNTQAGVDGAQIVKVPAGTPADKAGLRAGDIVIAVDGQRVTDQIEMIVAIRTHEPGQTITLSYLRNGNPNEVKITLAGETETEQ